MKNLVTSALLVITAIHPWTLEAQKQSNNQETTPKLVIGIAVDQLRSDYLQALQTRFCDGGFKRLMADGVVYEQVSFNLNQPDATAALAVLATGAYPFVNGITSEMVYNPTILREQNIFQDKNFIGNYTDATYSPSALISTTLGDELKTTSGGTARVFSIAPNAEAAIIGGGHTANCVFWIDDKTGQWASTTFYRDFPRYADRYNRSEAPNYNIELKHWTASYEAKGDHLEILPYHFRGDRPFDYTFKKTAEKPNYAAFKTSALVNEAVTKFCKTFIQNGMMGHGVNTDMIQLTYYAGTYLHENDEYYADELQDTYLRLDQTLADLLSSIDASVGLNNTFIYLTSTGDTNYKSKNVEGLSVGDFNANRCAALLNSYLISIYGKGNWVSGFDSNELFLNHKEIDNKQIVLSEIQKTSSEFVNLFSGVQEVVTAHQMLHEDYNDRIRKMRNAYHKDRSGDLKIILQAGWSIKADDISKSQPQTRHNVALGPAIFYAPHILKSQRISTPVEATTIAPTVAKCIRIRAPSGCEVSPLF